MGYLDELGKWIKKAQGSNKPAKKPRTNFNKMTRKEASDELKNSLGMTKKRWMRLWDIAHDPCK